MSCYLGLDYGLRRIGLAASDPTGTLAFAVGTHVEGRDGSVLVHLSGMIAEREVSSLVVGLPLTADGREGDMAVRVRKFARRLEEEFGLEVILWDERFSSAEADRWLADRAKTKKEERDTVAAQIILQSYLDHLHRGQGNRKNPR